MRRHQHAGAGSVPAPGQQRGSLPAEVGLVSVNVGLPRMIGKRRSGREILSGIVKTPVTVEALFLDTLNLEGDRQADLRVHGGPDKAVYAYPSEHLPIWNAELGMDPPFGAGAFGKTSRRQAGWRMPSVSETSGPGGTLCSK